MKRTSEEPGLDLTKISNKILRSYSYCEFKDLKKRRLHVKRSLVKVFFQQTSREPLGQFSNTCAEGEFEVAVHLVLLFGLFRVEVVDDGEELVQFVVLAVLFELLDIHLHLFLAELQS